MAVGAHSEVHPERHTIPVRNPADGSLVADIEVDSRQRVATVAASLRAVQPAWEELGVAGRKRWLTTMRNWLLDNTDRLGDIMQAEGGKVRAETVMEQSWLCDIINTYTRTAARLLADERVRARSPLLLGKRFTAMRRPYPLVGVIGPWNFPLVLSFGDAIPALFAGAAVLLKPSETTPLALREVVRAWKEEIAAPPVLDAVFGAEETGAALVDEVDFVQFTGSGRTGRQVALQAADRVIPVCLELGGKDPMIVLKDAPLARAANCAVAGGFVNNGQVCIATERVYVEEPVYEQFVECVAEKVRALRQDMDGPGIGSDVGAMTSAARLAIVEEQVRDAVAKGARVVTGGNRVERDGNWYEPTVLSNVNHSMKVMREETFGPLLPIMKVTDADEAVALANDSDLGLAASVFAGSVGAGERLARRIDVGTVNVNDYAVAAMCIDVPMGGWKRSGIGARSADSGLLKFTRLKVISAPRLPTTDREIWWPPYTAARQRWLRRALRLINARGVRARLGRRTWRPPD